tara:strand:+ start:576 stop:1025 length:450 start_codon:yes stop_codon:yes gene_type:complete
MFLTKFRPLEDSLSSWRPFLTDDVDNFAEWFFPNTAGTDGFSSPNIDLYDDKEDLVVRAEIPGANEKDIDVSLEDGILSIKGERKLENEDNKDSYYRIERSYGSFSRSFKLPVEVKTGDARASYKNGILEIRIPKEEKAKPKKIEINVN